MSLSRPFTAADNECRFRLTSEAVSCRLPVRRRRTRAFLTGRLEFPLSDPTPGTEGLGILWLDPRGAKIADVEWLYVAPVDVEELPS